MPSPKFNCEFMTLTIEKAFLTAWGVKFWSLENSSPLSKYFNDDQILLDVMNRNRQSQLTVSTDRPNRQTVTNKSLAVGIENWRRCDGECEMKRSGVVVKRICLLKIGFVSRPTQNLDLTQRKELSFMSDFDNWTSCIVAADAINTSYSFHSPAESVLPESVTHIHL